MTVLRNDLNRYIETKEDGLIAEEPSENQYRFLSFLDYTIKNIEFSRLGLILNLNVSRLKNQVFKIQLEEFDTFKDESLIIFLNLQNKILFTGTVASHECIQNQNIIFDEENQIEREIIVEEIDHNQKIKLRQEKKKKQQQHEEMPHLEEIQESQQQNIDSSTNQKKKQKKQIYQIYKIIVKIDLNKNNFVDVIKELFIEKNSNQKNLVLFEAMQYWLPFKYTYLSLKSMQQQDISFEKEIVKGLSKNQGSTSNNINDIQNYPKYNIFNLGQDIDFYFKDIEDRVDNLKQLDDTQQDCLKYMLKTPIALVQGPPGTGKTYVTFEAVKILLETYCKQKERKPIIIICRRNETVNDYLQRLIKYFEDLHEENKQQIEEKKILFKNLSKQKELSTYKDKEQHKNKAKQNSDKNNKQNSNSTEQKEQIDKDLSKLQEELKAYKKQQKYSPILRLGAGGDLEIEEKFLLPLNLKFPKKVVQIDEIKLRFNFLIQDQSSNQHICMKKWLKVGESFKNNFFREKQQIYDILKTLLKQFFYLNKRINELLINEFFSSESQEKKQQILDLQNDNIFWLWLNLKLNDQSISQMLDWELTIQQQKQLNYYQNQIIEQKQNYEEIYYEEIYQVITLKPLLLNKNGTEMQIDQDSITDYFDQFVKLSELSYYHIIQINEFIEYQLNSERIQSFYNLYSNFIIQSRQKKQELIEKQLKYFRKKSVILMTLTQSHMQYEQLSQLQPEIIIIDESAENNESEVAHLLSFQPKHYIQVGDHFQLKPLMHNKILQQFYKYGDSQFQRLFKLKLPNKALVIQRRMTNDLSKFVRLFYSRDTYKDPDSNKLNQSNQLNSQCQSNESKHRQYPFFVNIFEAYLCVKISERLLKKNIQPQQITIITMYKGQERLIREQIQYKAYDQNLKKIQVSTVDSYQGKENDVIILSCVKSNQIGNLGFLKQNNRINVAFSRAKKLAYYIGNFEFLSLKYFNSKWLDIKNMAYNHVDIQDDYLIEAVERFHDFYQYRKDIDKECMFCEKGPSHIGFCSKNKRMKIKKFNDYFDNLEERERFYEYQENLLKNESQNKSKHENSES